MGSGAVDDLKVGSWLVLVEWDVGDDCVRVDYNGLPMEVMSLEALPLILVKPVDDSGLFTVDVRRMGFRKVGRRYVNAWDREVERRRDQVNLELQAGHVAQVTICQCPICGNELTRTPSASSITCSNCGTIVL
jgi:ribosomal protein S27E